MYRNKVCCWFNPIVLYDSLADALLIRCWRWRKWFSFQYKCEIRCFQLECFCNLIIFYLCIHSYCKKIKVKFYISTQNLCIENYVWLHHSRLCFASLFNENNKGNFTCIHSLENLYEFYLLLYKVFQLNYL